MNRPHPGRRPRTGPLLTIRTRLTLFYGALLLGTGTVLLSLVFLYMTYAPDYQFAGASVAATPARPMPSAPAGPGVPSETLPVEGGQAVRPVVSSESDLHTSLLRVCGAALLVCTVTALGLGSLAAKRALAPMSHITRAAAGIASRNLHARVHLTGPQDEVKELADTFDGMLARLEAAFEAQRRFAANASHELLSPLAASQALLDVAAARPEACDVPALTEKLMAANERSTHVVEALLTLARADHGTVNRHPVDLAATAAEAVERIRSDAEAAQVAVDVRVVRTGAQAGYAEPVVACADAALLGPLTDNLLRNAVRHNHPGGTVTVEVTRREAGGAAVLTVANTGPHVPREKVSRLFEPFFRLDGRTHRAERAGHGLGMAIIRAVAEAHGGSVAARPNPEGGLTVTVTLAPGPAAPGAARTPPDRTDRSGRTGRTGRTPQDRRTGRTEQAAAARPSLPS